MWRTKFRQSCKELFCQILSFYFIFVCGEKPATGKTLECHKILVTLQILQYFPGIAGTKLPFCCFRGHSNPVKH